MRILHVTPTFYPATVYGGPIYTTYALCNALAALAGVELQVLTTDAAGKSRHESLPVDKIPARYPAGYHVIFTHRVAGNDFAPGMLARLKTMIAWSDVVMLTGTYSAPTIPTLAMARLLGKPVLWSPRGALLAAQSWGETSRPRIKRAWEAICNRLMPAQTLLHVTSAEEAAASVARLPRAKASVIPNGVEIPDVIADKQWRRDGRLHLMFLGRIVPIKAIDQLIAAIPKICGQAVDLDVYGSGDVNYLESLRALALAQGCNDRVHFRGHVQDDGKRAAFARADICILPSHSENFGMAVAEALAHGVPVVVSKGVPWEGVEPRGCGRWVDNSPSALAGAISALATGDLAEMGARGRQWMTDEFSWDGVAARTRMVLDALVSSNKARGA